MISKKKKYNQVIAWIILQTLPQFAYSIKANIDNLFYISIFEDKLFKVSYFLTKSSFYRFSVLCDILAVDLLLNKKRFSLFYTLLSVSYNQRVNLELFCAENSEIISLTSVFNSSNWLEREVKDMFGIFFKNHPDLRRILTDYGFSDKPLLKDFSSVGLAEVRYDELMKRLNVGSLGISQNRFRELPIR